MGSVGSIGFLQDFEFYMAVFGVGRCLIGLVAPWRFKMLDSQPEKSNMGPVQADFHDFFIFRKSQDDCLARYLSCFRAGASKSTFSNVLVGTKKLRDEKLCRFVVVSPREVPSLPFSCPFKILIFRPFLNFPVLFLFQFLQKSVHQLFPSTV